MAPSTSSPGPNPPNAFSSAMTLRTSLEVDSSALDPSSISATPASELELVEAFAEDQEYARAILSYTEDGLGDKRRRLTSKMMVSDPATAQYQWSDQFCS